MPSTPPSVPTASSDLQQILLKQAPSPDQGKFASDLYTAIQHHAPLTLLQKLFILVSLFPGPFSWKLAFFSYLATANWHQPISIGMAVLGGVLALLIIRSIVRTWHAKREPLVFLELAFPSTTTKSAHATEQFLTLLHAVAGQRGFVHRVLGRQKRYALEIVASREHGIRYVIGVVASDVATIRRGLLSYIPGLRIQPTEDYVPTKERGHRLGSARIVELQLRGDFALPLQTQKLLAEHDPIAYLTGNMTKLQPNELVAFQVVVTPVTRDARFVTKHIQRLSRRLYLNQPLSDELFTSPFMRFVTAIGDILTFVARAVWTMIDVILGIVLPGYDSTALDTQPAARPITNPIEDELRTAVKQKIDQPLSVTSLRLLIYAKDAISVHERSSGFLATFGPLASTYQLFVRKTGLALLDVQPSLVRFRNRQLSLFNNPVLSPSEVTDIYHFPYTDTTKTEDLVRVKSPALPAPLPYKQESRQLDAVFATNRYGGSDTPIGLTLEERRRHTYILGATGTGKTTLLAQMIYQDIIRGKGLAVVDPHGQLVEQILRTIPEDRIKDVVWFAPDDDGYPIALNLLDLPTIGDGELTPSQLQKQKSLVVSSINSIFQKFYDAKYFGPRMEYVLRNAVLTALETPQPTLVTILDLLTKQDYRREIVSRLPAGVLRDFWDYEFNKLGTLQRNQMISPITNKIGGILSAPLNYNILSQPTSKLNFEEVMNTGKILLCDLSKGKIGEDESSFFGSLVIAKLQLAALSRARIPETERRDFFLYIDEFQNFATSAITGLVSEARKYRLATILAHQSISQIEDRDIVKVILANVGTTMAFRTANPEDEQFILPIFAPQVSKHDIANLPLYTVYMKVAVGEPQDAFKAEVNDFVAEGSGDTAQAVIEYSRGRFATPVGAVDPRNRPTPSTTDPRQENPGQSGSVGQNPFPLSLTGTEYGRDWQGGTAPTQKTKHQLTLTTQQHTILLHLLRFRFLDRSHLQRLLGLTDYKNLNKLLRQLTAHRYIANITRTKAPTIYHLAINGITELKAHPEIDERSLKKLAREHDRSDAFVTRCLTLATINLNLRRQVTKTVKHGMFVSSDYPALSLGSELTELAPHAVVIRQKGGTIEQSLIEIVSDVPLKHLRTQLKRYTDYFNKNTWQRATNMPFPTIRLIAADPAILAKARRATKQLMADFETMRPTISLSTAENVRQHSITTDEIWETLN